MNKTQGLITECRVESINYGHGLRKDRTTLTITIEGYASLDPSKPVTLTQEEDE